MIEITPESPQTPEARTLLAALDDYLYALYPPESVHRLDPAILAGPGCTFLVARYDGKAQGCGALWRHASGWGEIKRVYVTPTSRGRGVGRAIMTALYDQALAEGLAVVRLETGVDQPEALALFRATGMTEIGRFGDYPEDPLSVYFERRLHG